MAKLKQPAPTVDKIEAEFLEAIERLKQGRPIISKNKMALKAGKLKISIKSVALEAGRSRTLIALERCAYPRVRNIVREIMIAQRGQGHRTSNDAIGTLQDTIATLRAQLADAQEKMAAQAIAVDVERKDWRTREQALQRSIEYLTETGGKVVSITETKRS